MQTTNSKDSFTDLLAGYQTRVIQFVHILVDAPDSVLSDIVKNMPSPKLRVLLAACKDETESRNRNSTHR